MTRVYHVLKFLNDSKIKDGRDVIADNQYPGCPYTSQTDDDIEKVYQIIQENHWSVTELQKKLFNIFYIEILTWIKYIQRWYSKIES